MSNNIHEWPATDVIRVYGDATPIYGHVMTDEDLRQRVALIAENWDNPRCLRQLGFLPDLGIKALASQIKMLTEKISYKFVERFWV